MLSSFIIVSDNYDGESMHSDPFAQYFDFLEKLTKKPSFSVHKTILSDYERAGDEASPSHLSQCMALKYFLVN